MFNRNTKHQNYQDEIELVPVRRQNEIARVLLMGHSEVIIYRDGPGHLSFGLFNPAPRKG